MKHVLLVADTKGWCFWHWCQGIKRYAPTEYVVEVTAGEGFWHYTNGDRGFDGIDAVLQCSWTEANANIPTLNNTLLASHGAEHHHPHTDPKDVPSHIATRLRNRNHAEDRLPQFDSVLCVSRALADVCREITPNGVYCHPGVDTELFRPTARPENKHLRIGWCGQRNGLTKGYDELLAPLMKECPRFDWQINDSGPASPRFTSRDEMVAWYNSLDLFISTSCSEGSQSPVLEAAACGVPVIATNVGTAAEVVNDMDTGYIMPAWRTAQDARAQLPMWVDILNSLKRNRLWAMGQGARQRVETLFGWNKLAKQWLGVICGD